jgi:hypothetical protein
MFHVRYQNQKPLNIWQELSPRVFHSMEIHSARVAGGES